ncbi:MAG: hypothetical protein AAF514_13990, partial [Verrucomicrobiota bacterium]
QLDGMRAPDQKEAFDLLAAEILESDPGNTEVMLAQLKRIDNDGETRKKNLLEILRLCDELLSQIDEKAVAAGLGVREVEGQEPDLLNGKTPKAWSALLQDLHYRKCRALAYRDGEAEKRGETFDPAPFNEAYDAMARWVDMSEGDFLLVRIRKERRENRFGTALKLLNGLLKKSPTDRKLHEKRQRILAKLGWQDWEAWEKQWFSRRFPKEIPEF